MAAEPPGGTVNGVTGDTWNNPPLSSTRLNPVTTRSAVPALPMATDWTAVVPSTTSPKSMEGAATVMSGIPDAASKVTAADSDTGCCTPLTSTSADALTVKLPGALEVKSTAHDPAASVVQVVPAGNEPPVAAKVTTTPATGAGPVPSSTVTVATTPAAVPTASVPAGPAAESDATAGVAVSSVDALAGSAVSSVDALSGSAVSSVDALADSSVASALAGSSVAGSGTGSGALLGRRRSPACSTPFIRSCEAPPSPRPSTWPSSWATTVNRSMLPAAGPPSAAVR